jgi:hypothetical protein
MTGLWSLTKVGAAEHAGVSPSQSASSTVNSPVEDALQHFDRWAAQQELYSPVMIGDMRQRLQGRFAASSPDGRSELRDEILQRLDVFQEPLSQDAANWVLQTLAVASDAYATKLRAQLPDPVDDGVDTMRAKFRALVLSRVGLQRYRAGFDQTRQAAVASVQNDAQHQAAINSQLRAGMTFSSPNLYTPGANRIDASARYRGYTTHRYANPYPFGGVWFF